VDESARYTVPHIKYGDRLMVGYRYWTTPASIRSSRSASASATPHSALPTFRRLPRQPQVPRSQSASTSPTPAPSPEPKSPSSTSPTPRPKPPAPSANSRDFKKVRLAPGETTHVTLNLDARAFSYWDDAGAQVDHRSRQVRHPRRRLQRKHAAPRRPTLN